MGALGPVHRWIPEDDLLLKNAVEGGASLESLAKGAVKFSQKFTVRELQERWYSILYDPVVSSEASAGMTESERSSSVRSSSKANKAGASKEKKAAVGKRKVEETVRSYYEAQRRRMCSEAFDAMDLSFLVGPANGDGDGPLSGNCDPIVDQISNPFGIQASESNTIAHAFPIHTFPTGLQNLPEENFEIDQNNMHEGISHFLGDNMPSTEMGEPNNLPENSLFEVVDQDNGGQPNGCLDFEGNKIFNNMEYSPLPGMGLPVDIGLADKDLLSGGTLHLPGDYESMSVSTSGYDVHSDVKVKMETAYDSFQVHNSPEGILAELSNSLLNFTNEEELLFMNGDGKDIIDKSYYDGLSSLLLNSPNDTSQEEHVADVTEPEPETSAGINLCAASLGLCTESNEVSENCDEQMSCDPQIQMQSSSIPSMDLEFPEFNEGVICCVLNTEDPNIPCNDGVSLLRAPLISKSTMVDQRLLGGGTSISSPAMDFDERGPNLMQKEKNNTGESRATPSSIGSLDVQEMGRNLAVSNFGVSSMSRVGSDLINAVTNGTVGFLPEIQKDKAQEVLMAKHQPNSTDYSFKKPALASMSVNGYPQTNSICVKEERDVVNGAGDQEPEHAEPIPMNIAVSEPVLNGPTEDQNVTFESDGDVPYFSDIEAMILDMDLEPDVHDLHTSEEVSRFQLEDTKRTIIRLEQSAHAHIQRAIAFHGAIAILYGRRSKHYIKKSEVLLGRATNEDRVDIDLGREGNANKVSRKQAIIKMDKGGYFTMKNLSDSPIWVNNKEIGYKQSILLNSSCLIEIRGMPYIFESNQTRVKMYLDSNAGATQI